MYWQGNVIDSEHEDPYISQLLTDSSGAYHGFAAVDLPRMRGLAFMHSRYRFTLLIVVSSFRMTACRDPQIFQDGITLATVVQVTRTSSASNGHPCGSGIRVFSRLCPDS